MLCFKLIQFYLSIIIFWVFGLLLPLNKHLIYLRKLINEFYEVVNIPTINNLLYKLCKLFIKLWWTVFIIRQSGKLKIKIKSVKKMLYIFFILKYIYLNLFELMSNCPSSPHIHWDATGNFAPFAPFAPFAQV